MNIYVACPSDFETGGIELLHQLTAELNKYVNTFIWYFSEGKTPERYLKYENKVTYTPDKDGVLIFPEIWADYVNLYPDHVCIIYWESVDNYFLHTKNDKLVFSDNVYHLAQSNYAMKFLLDTVGIPMYRIMFLTDYINDAYFHLMKTEREQIVLYNPLKGVEFTNRIIEKAPEITFVPITGLDQKKVINLMSRSMVYIDFGNHPGKDRLPRETAMCGCCVITGLDGSARYDVNIPRQYKFARQENNISDIIKKIKYVLENYKICCQDFDRYRDTIKDEKLEFQLGVQELADKLVKGGLWHNI